MARARLDAAWDHTAALLAALYNCALGSKGRYRPYDFHPAARRKPVRMSRKESLDYLGRFSSN